MTIDVATLRAREFPVARDGVIYLDSASTGPLPARSVAAAQRLAAERAEPQRITLEWILETLARGRELCAKAIGARPAEIAIATNTGYGLNLAARALPLDRGDVVVTFDGEFPANIYPWMALRERGVELVRIPPRDGLPDEEALLAALDRPRVRAATVSWVQFASGHRIDLARLGENCRAREIFLVVDAIQGVGAATLDLSATHVDILACGAQKWLLGPWGSGFTYVREALIERLTPPVVGWTAVTGTDDFRTLTSYELAFRHDARRFEVLTLPFHDVATMNVGLELLHELGMRHVAARIEALSTFTIEGATARGLEVLTCSDPARRAGIVALRTPDGDAAMQRLDLIGCRASFREGLVRLSPHCFNTEAELDAALDALADARAPGGVSG